MYIGSVPLRVDAADPNWTGTLPDMDRDLIILAASALSQALVPWSSLSQAHSGVGLYLFFKRQAGLQG